jgi:Tfp pilus assembly protein PilV
MRKKIRSRLKSNRGESLGEVLIAVMISALGLVLLASMINGAKEAVIRSKETVSTYMTANNRLVENTEGSSGSGSVGFASIEDIGTTATRLTDSSPETISVLYYINDTFHSYAVTSYKRDSEP